MIRADEIVVTTIPPGFPVPKKQKVAEEGGGRGFVFVKDAEIVDSSEPFMSLLPLTAEIGESF